MQQPLQSGAPSAGTDLDDAEPRLGTRSLRGVDGTVYPFALFSLRGRLPSVGAVYCLCRRTPQANGLNLSELVHVGQTSNVAACLLELAPGRPLAAHSANVLGIYPVDSEFLRHRILRDLASALPSSIHSTRRRPEGRRPIARQCR